MATPSDDDAPVTETKTGTLAYVGAVSGGLALVCSVLK